MTEDLQSGHIYSATALNDLIGGKHQGGIRYSGNLLDRRRTGVIIGGGADAIYDDQIARGSITYVGEGQDQELACGNRALVWAYFQDMPLHVFLNQGKNRYRYLGDHRVEAASATIALDRNDADRGAFLFRLTPTRG